MQITLFYIPVSTQSEATTLGRRAIDHRLAACINVFPIQSIFPWEGKIDNQEEYVLVLKTFSSLKKKVSEFISQHHSYELPCIMSWEVEVNDEYGKWMELVLGNVSTLTPH